MRISSNNLCTTRRAVQAQVQALRRSRCIGEAPRTAGSWLPSTRSAKLAAPLSSSGDAPPQAGDLRRLLALYEGWHRRVFPCTTFDGFLEDLEKLGATAACKVCTRVIWHAHRPAAVPLRGACRQGVFWSLCVLYIGCHLPSYARRPLTPDADHQIGAHAVSVAPLLRPRSQSYLFQGASAQLNRMLVQGGLGYRHHRAPSYPKPLAPLQAQLRELRQGVMKIAEVPEDEAPPPEEVRGPL